MDFIITVAIIFGLPALTGWGWVRWSLQPKEHTVFARLSLAAFGLATLSSLLAVGSMVYSATTGGLPDYSPAFIRIFKSGMILSLAAIALGAAGAFRPSKLRWHAPVCGFGILMFWFFSAISE
jgi:hypothetical protein